MEESKTFEGTYLKKYYCFAIFLSAACVVCMALIGIFAFTKNTWSYGIIVLLALSLVLAILAIISWVALYREKGRYHERRFPIEVDNKMKSLKVENQSLKVENQSLKVENQSLKVENQSLKVENQSLNEGNQSLKADIQSLNEGIQSLKADIQSLNGGIPSQTADIQSLKDENKNLTEANIELKEAEEQPSEEN